MGAYAATNEDTFPNLLEIKLQSIWPDRKVEVINGGIAGYGLSDQRVLLDKILVPLVPDLVILYSGFNDFATYCRHANGDADAPQFVAYGLPQMQLPNWLLSVDLLLKNTVALRAAPTTQGRFIDPATIDMSRYIGELHALVDTARSHGTALVLTTNPNFSPLTGP